MRKEITSNTCALAPHLWWTDLHVCKSDTGLFTLEAESPSYCQVICYP